MGRLLRDDLAAIVSETGKDGFGIGTHVRVVKIERSGSGPRPVIVEASSGRRAVVSETLLELVEAYRPVDHTNG